MGGFARCDGEFGDKDGDGVGRHGCRRLRAVPCRTYRSAGDGTFRAAFHGWGLLKLPGRLKAEYDAERPARLH